MAEGASKGGDEPGKLPEQEEEEESQVLHGTGHCKWFNVRMGFGFISMSNREGSPLESPVDVFVHQSKLYMEGFRSLKEGEPVEFTFKKSSKGLESIRVTGPGGSPCLGSERRPKGKTVQKRKPKGDRCYINQQAQIYRWNDELQPTLRTACTNLTSATSLGCCCVNFRIHTQWEIFCVTLLKITEKKLSEVIKIALDLHSCD